ncbi:hypothetical protein Tco_0955893 [Tanacetum coccineum]|uniref:Retrovirus-related Pol polyprotein from transposon TNT 1-94-like beta-barrel domain-containing protein n=1 Tax=Tanacetum coccineum TaxID=301880 RepID=A0ABQ5E8F9_9ASTR
MVLTQTKTSPSTLPHLTTLTQLPPWQSPLTPLANENENKIKGCDYGTWVGWLRLVFDITHTTNTLLEDSHRESTSQDLILDQEPPGSDTNCGVLNNSLDRLWNNAQRVNHQNKFTHPHPKKNFVLTTVVTKSGQVPVNTTKQSSPRAATSISTTRPVNIAAPKSKVNDALPKKYSYFKAHSPVRRAFNQKSTAKTNNLNEKVKTARVKNVTTTRPKAIGNPQYTLQDQGIFDSGCSRHMTGNKSYLTDYQEVDGGFVAFAGSPKGDIIISGLPQCVAITPALSTEEPVDSLIMEDEHLDTIPTTESDKFIKFSVENLVENPSESEDFSDIEIDNETFSDEDVPTKNLFEPSFR